VLEVPEPFANHNGGQIAFGPDGYLYIGLGDGGSARDPEGNGQNLNTLLGKVLRLDPTPSGGLPYTIPADNPFVGRADARGEVFAYGLRNPWRNSFDRLTGDLWLGDVGQNTTEEVDFVSRDASRGANFGWSAYEGSKRFKPAIPAEGHVPPVHEYPTQEGCAVTGGYVYRGGAIPGLAGVYIFSDFCNGRIQALRMAGGQAVEHRSLGLEAEQLASFAEGPDGELYVLSLAGGMFRIEPA
ncbi:MAG TPA: PQQ-dependent sugar dehydrogenase, partial [Acidimicrobiia bacterium]|nr:PQQ-dependent sugar dehydrogenase [Acidimicrobiia bacterium]